MQANYYFTCSECGRRRSTDYCEGCYSKTRRERSKGCDDLDWLNSKVEELILLIKKSKHHNKKRVVVDEIDWMEQIG